MTALEDLTRISPAEGFIDRQIYRDPEILQLEKERIFRKTWHFACVVGELKRPGDFRTLSVGDEPVLVVKGNDDKIRAFYNACTHRGATLTGDPRGNYGQVFKCMYHAWAFNLLGELIAVPYEEGYGDTLNKNEYGLVPIRCETFKDLIFVSVDPHIVPFTDYLGAYAAHLGPYVEGIEVIGRNSWIYEGNWKLWHENFRDNYHPQFTHRSINDQGPHYADSGGNWGFDEGHSVLQWSGPRAPSMQGYVKSLERHSGVELDGVKPRYRRTESDEVYDKDGRIGEVHAIFPNLDVQPGLGLPNPFGNSGFLQTVVPIGVERARVDITVYTSIHDSDEIRQRNLDNMADSQGSWGKVSCDDTEAASRVQTGIMGLGTRYNIFTRGVGPGLGGTNAQSRDEYSQRAFYRAYVRYMANGD